MSQYPPLNSTGDWYDANWEGDMARAAQARDAAIKKRDDALEKAIDEICRACGGIHGDPSPQQVREILAKQGLWVVFGSGP